MEGSRAGKPGGWGAPSARLEGTLAPGSGSVAWIRGGRGGETEGGSSLQMGDMLEPDTDMLGEVAGELVVN